MTMAAAILFIFIPTPGLYLEQGGAPAPPAVQVPTARYLAEDFTPLRQRPGGWAWRREGAGAGSSRPWLGQEGWMTGGDYEGETHGGT